MAIPMLIYVVAHLIGDDGAWEMLGIFLTEEDAVNHCTKDEHFLFPSPLDSMLPGRAVDGIYFWWPRIQTKDEALGRLLSERIDAHWFDGRH